jgi:hypothetical protein
MQKTATLEEIRGAFISAVESIGIERDANGVIASWNDDAKLRRLVWQVAGYVDQMLGAGGIAYGVLGLATESDIVPPTDDTALDGDVAQDVY